MIKEFLVPDKRKLAKIAILTLLLIPTFMIGSESMEKADTPSYESPLLDGLEETGPLGQFIITVCSIIYLLLMIPVFFFAFIFAYAGLGSGIGFVIGIIIVALLLYAIACLLNAAFLLMARKASKSQGNPG